MSPPSSMVLRWTTVNLTCISFLLFDRTPTWLFLCIFSCVHWIPILAICLLISSTASRNWIARFNKSTVGRWSVPAVSNGWEKTSDSMMMLSIRRLIEWRSSGLFRRQWTNGWSRLHHLWHSRTESDRIRDVLRAHLHRAADQWSIAKLHCKLRVTNVHLGLLLSRCQQPLALGWSSSECTLASHRFPEDDFRVELWLISNKLNASPPIWQPSRLAF